MNAEGLLDVGNGQRIHWEEHGNPGGVPVVVLHGGPGSGSSPLFTRFFDLERFRVVLYDQRNCGQSTPHASDPTVSLEHNRFKELLDDLAALRVHLGIDRWLMVGQSFGTTLGLAYAETWPETLRGLVVIGAALGSPAEIDWLYGGAGAFFPLEYARFVEILDESERDDPVPAYRRRLESETPRCAPRRRCGGQSGTGQRRRLPRRLCRKAAGRIPRSSWRGRASARTTSPVTCRLRVTS